MKNLQIRILVLLIFVILGNTGFAQNGFPYRFSLARDIPMTTVGVGMLGTSLILDAKKSPLTEQQINNLQATDIWKFDRPATRHWSPSAALASDIFMYTAMILPVTLYAIPSARENWLETGALYAETMLLNAGLTNLVKNIAKRTRPYNYNPDAPMHKKLEKDATESFFSGHTSFTATSTFFLAKMYADLRPNSKFKPAVWTMAAVIPAITGYLRFHAGKHYPTDIIVGYGVGAAVGVLVPFLHRKSAVLKN